MRHHRCAHRFIMALRYLSSTANKTKFVVCFLALCVFCSYIEGESMFKVNAGSAREYISCEGTLHSKINKYGRQMSCCGQESYDSLQSKCCGGVILKKSSHSRMRCCNNTVYDTRDNIQFICDTGGKLVRSTVTDSHLCDEDPIEENQTCCNGRLFETPGTTANGGRCCGFVDVVGYNPRYEICCRGVLYTYTFQGCSTVNGQLFVSRVLGNDNNNCTRYQPCKTIRRAVLLSNSGDSIAIDATNTDISPYEECQQQGGETVGIEVKKSLHFLSANGTAVISGSSSCSVFDFDGSQMTLKSREPMEVSLTGLKFINGTTPRSKLGAFVTVSDASLTVTDCEFVNGTANDMTLAKQYYSVHYTLKTVIGNSLFNLNFTGANLIDNIGGIFVVAEQNTSSRDTLVFTMRNSTVHQSKKGAITIKIKKVGKIIGHVEKTVFSDNRHDQGAGIYFEETQDSHGDEHGVTNGSLNRYRGDCNLTDDVINYLDDIRMDSQKGGYLPNEYINSETWRKYLICKADQQRFNETVEMTLDNVNFTNNNVTDAGGALFSAVTGRTTVRMTQVMFEKNSANGLGGRGGALYVRGGQVQIYASDFTDNSATFSGGAVFLDDVNGSFVMDGSVLKSTEDVRGQETLLWSMYKGIFLVTNTRFEATTTKHDSVDVFWHESPANISLDKSSSVICSVGYNLTLKQSYNYKNYDIIYSCRPCQHGTYSIERGYSNGTEVTDITCRKCPSGGNCEKPTLRAKSNFWGYEQNRSVSLLLCPPGYCCSGRENGTCDGYQSCQDHRIGAVCGKCEDGYTESVVSTKCLTKEKCSENRLVFSILLAVVIIVLTAMFVVFSLFWYKKTEHNRGDIEDNSDRRNSEVGDINSTWIGYIKLTFFFYQVIVYLTRPRGKHDSISAVTAVPFIVNLFNFRFVPDFLDSCYSALSTYTLKVVFVNLSVIVPILTLILTLYFIIDILRFRRKTGSRSYKPAVAFAFAMATTFGYICFVNLTFSLLQYVRIGDEYRLYYSGEEKFFGPGMYIAVVLAVFIAVPFVFLPAIALKKLQSGKWSLRDFVIFSFIPLPYLIYECIVTCIYSRKTATLSTETIERQTSLKVDDITQSVVCFYKGNYGDRFWYWESIMLGRRLLIVVCHVFIHNEFIRTVVLVSCCSAFLFHHVFAKPYITGFLNHAETAFLLLLITVGLINTVDAFCYSYGATTCKPGEDILKDMCILSCVLALVPLMIPLIALLRRCVQKSLRRLPCCKEFTKLKLHSEDQSSTTSDVQALLSEDIDEESEDRQRCRTASQSIKTPGTNGPRRPRIYSHTIQDNGPSSLLADVTTFGADCTDGGSILQESILLPSSPDSNGSEPNRVNVNVPEKNGHTTKSVAGNDKEDAAATNDRLLRRMREENVYLKACLQQLAKILSAANDPEILSSTNFTTTVFAAGVFNYEGGHLTIEQAGVNLFIPPGALSEDDGHQQFYVYVSTIDSEYPRVADNQTALSPVIRLGPPGFRFQKHVLLSVKNCIDSKQSGSLKLFGSHTDIDDLVDWYDTSERQQTLCIAQGEDAISFIHQLSMYCVISDVTSCNYNVHIFMTAINNTYTRIRVRISRDTPADVELVKMKEQAGDNYQYKDQRMVVLHKTDGDYKIELTEVSPKTWNLVDGESVKIISKESLWMNNQGGGPCPGVTYLLERGHQQGFRQISGAIELKKVGHKTPICTLAFKDDLALA